MPIGNLIRFGGRALGQAVDPTNYRFLKEATENVLSRTVPQGVNFGAMPTQFLNTLTDIQRMVPGAAKEVARNKAKTTLTRAARLQAPAPRPVGQGAGGLLRAPSIGNVPTRVTSYQSTRPITTLAPRTNIPGSPLATDYALSRQTGMTQALGQARKAGQVGAQNFLGRMMGAGGGKLGFGFDLLNPVPGIGVGGSIAKGLGLTGLAGGATTVGGGLLAAGAVEAAFPRGFGDGTLEGAIRSGKLDPLEARRLYAATGDMDAGPGLVSKTNDPSQADYIAPPSAPVFPPAPVLPPAPGLPPEERAYQAELARTQQMMAANPYMPQTQLYAQGQSMMQTPEDMAATRDLGLAINRAMYGDVLTPKTPNPLMAGLTPPPGTQAVIPMDEEGRIVAAGDVQEFMRKYKEGMNKRGEG